MSHPLVLALPDFTKPFVIECDALGTSLGAILMQNHMPLAFHSQALKGRSLLLTTYEKELLALVTTVKKRRPYLVGRPFVIKTDQQSLKLLLEQRIGTPTQQKWFTKLLTLLLLSTRRVRRIRQLMPCLEKKRVLICNQWMVLFNLQRILVHYSPS